LASAFPTNAGNYSVVITSAYGSVTSSNALLTVNVPPTILVQPQVTTGITGGSVAFSVVASGDPTLLYQWAFNGAPLANATNATLTLTNLQASQAGLYSVVVSNPFGTATSTNAALTVKVAPFVATQPQSLTVVQGSNATFSVTAGGDGPFAYQWFYSGVLVTGATNAALTLTGVVTNQAGNYYVTITSPYGSVASSNALLTVKVPPAIIVQPLSQTIVVGVTANLSVTATGDLPLSYQWRFNGTPITGATNPTLTLPGIRANQTGDYTVVVSNPYGTVTSSIATLSVKTPPFVATQPQSLTVLKGTNAAFSVTAGKNGVDLAGATNAMLTLTNISAADVGNYCVKVTNADGSVTSITVPLTLSQRTLTVVTVQTTNFTTGTPISVPIVLLAEGGENRVLGSIAYDTNKLNFTSVTTPVGATLASTNAAGQGQIGFDVTLPAAQTFTPGSNVVVFVNFTVAAGVTQSIAGVNLQGVPVTNQVLNAASAPLPSYFISGAVIFKSLTDYTLRSQTGATEESIPVLNPAGSVSALTLLRISFFDLGKDSLGNAIYLINATGTNNGIPYILIPTTVAPAGTFPLSVEYYVSDRVTTPKPRLVVEIVTGGYPVTPAGLVLSADRSQFNTATGRFVVDFSSIAGMTYYIQYSSSPAGPYDTSFPGVAGTGGRLQWVDTGPPRTTSLPASAGSRFYRILQVP
ncbi:MAG: hypothetical protein EB034_06030, partial [Verrucomicrobia bacterium]|nr:hypothetical protein [Verrucomicrobiota bacterium]